MNMKTDFRIRKTYTALVDALLQLMSEKRFEEITINELCERAMVRRATFYNHFSDKMEFFAFCVRELLSRCDSTKPFIFYSRNRCEAAIRCAVCFIERNDQLILQMLESNLLSSLLGIISDEISADLSRKIHGSAAQNSVNVMAPFYAGALVSTALWWITRKDYLTAEDLVAQLVGLLEPSLLGVFAAVRA